MDIHQLRTFVAVAELQHLTQAAERLHLSQPAASAHIKALEQYLRIDLFERRAGGLVLTSAGQELLNEAREILGACASLTSKARALSNDIAGTLRLGLRIDLDLSALADLVQAIRRAFPRLDLKLHQLRTLSILGGVQNGELDAGLVLYRELPVGLQGINLSNVGYRVVIPTALGLNASALTVDEIVTLPWIGAPRGGSHDQMLESLFGSRSRAIKNVIESDYEAMHVALIDRGLGVALMREDKAKTAQDRGTLSIWPGGYVDSTIRFIFSARRAREPAIRSIRDLVGRQLA